MGCSDLLAGAHEQGIGAITDRGIGPDAAYEFLLDDSQFGLIVRWRTSFGTRGSQVQILPLRPALRSN